MGSSDLSDAELLSLVAAHDARALRVFHDRHAPWLLARLRHRSSNDDVVFDALQDTFVAVWRTADSWRGEGEPAAWLWGIASRRLIGVQRSGMYRYRVETATGRVIADLRLVIPGTPVDPNLVIDPTPTPGPGVIDDVALAWLAAADAAVEPIRDGNDGPMLWPLGAFHDADTGLVTVPLTVGWTFGVLQIDSFEVMEQWDHDTLDVIVPGEQTAVGILNVYTPNSDPATVYVELTLPDDQGVKLRLDGYGHDWETAADVLLEIVAAHGGGV